MKKKWIFATVTVLLVGTTTSYYFIRKNRSFDLISPKVGPITEAIYGLGTVTSKDKFSFKVGVPKTIRSLYVREGQQVEKGEKILQFDDETVVKSPFRGTVFSLPYHIGENVFTDLAVVEIENVHQLYIDTILDQQSSMRVKKLDPVKISFETIENRFFSGQVTALYHSNSNFIARVEATDLPPNILPGMTADIAIEVAQKESALLIPVRAVQHGQVLIERNNKRLKVAVTLGLMDQEWVEVTSGTIQPDDLILLKKVL
jgi:macrolide-specific efflux system membrane fusion protein